MSFINPLGEHFLKHLSDVRVIVENKGTKWDFPAHSLVLKGASPLFTKMLEGESVEGKSKTIIITDFRANLVKQFLKFSYTSTLPDTYATLCKLMRLAHKYVLPILRVRCERALLDFVNFQNIYELCNLADMYSHKELRGSCLSFIKKAAFKLLKCDEIEYLSEDIMKDIVAADELNVRREMDVFWAIWRWGKLNVRSEGREDSDENIAEFCKNLLNHVRWNLLDYYDLQKIESLPFDRDMQKQNQPRIPSRNSMRYSLINQCKVLNLDDCSSSSPYIKSIHLKNCIESCFLRSVSLADAPFYVVGVLFACTDDPVGVRLTCRCESQSSDAAVDSKNSKSLYIESVLYQESFCEFDKPVEVCKNQTLTIHASGYATEFGMWELSFDRKHVFNCGRKISVEGSVYGIRKLFVL